MLCLWSECVNLFELVLSKVEGFVGSFMNYSMGENLSLIASNINKFRILEILRKRHQLFRFDVSGGNSGKMETEDARLDDFTDESNYVQKFCERRSEVWRDLEAKNH
jgi:hypothetical protein